MRGGAEWAQDRRMAGDCAGWEAKQLERFTL